jgi:DNA-binding CsgD family transcriptional regulator
MDYRRLATRLSRPRQSAVMVIAPGGGIHSLTDEARRLLEGLPKDRPYTVPSLAESPRLWRTPEAVYTVRSFPLPAGSLLAGSGAASLSPRSAAEHLESSLRLPPADASAYLVVLIEALTPVDPAQGKLVGLDLTARQEQIAVLLIRGCNRKEIAKRCGISPTTVKEHIARIYRKAGVCNRAEFLAALLAGGRAAENESGLGQESPDET